MSRNALILVIVVLAAIACMILYIVLPQRIVSHKITNTIQQTQSPSTNTGVPGSISFSDFLSSGGNKKCSYQDANSHTEGTVYISDNIIRGDFISAQTKVSLFVDGENIYIWKDASKNGVSLPESAINKISSIVSRDGISHFDSNTKENYSCNAWKADPSVLGVPNAVTFTPYKG